MDLLLLQERGLNWFGRLGGKGAWWPRSPDAGRDSSTRGNGCMCFRENNLAGEQLRLYRGGGGINFYLITYE